MLIVCRRMLLGALVLAALSTLANAQQAARDSILVSSGRVGTGAIGGRVTLGDAAQTSVRRAVVALTSADSSTILAAISGEDGRFIVERVPPGRYTLEARKSGHLTVVYGVRHLGRPGTTLIVADGERIDGLTLTLPLGAVLAGRVTLPDGQPLFNVQVVAIPSGLASAGAASAALERDFRIDRLGEFRLFGLKPGTYFLAALPALGQGEFEVMSHDSISAVLRQLQAGTAPVAPVQSPTAVAYVPTYFPGTPLVGDATPITVATGQVREALNFAIVAFPAATIRGHVVGTDGTPTPAVALSLEPVGPVFPPVAAAVGRVERVNQEGGFEIAAVPPGVYRLRARAGGVTLNAKGVASIHPAAQTQYAVSDVDVSGQDINGIVLMLQEGHRLSGTLTSDGSAALPAWAGASVIVQPITGSSNALAGVLTTGVPARDGMVDGAGRFIVTGLEPFDYEIRVTLPPLVAKEGWHIESVRYADRDLRDAPITFTRSVEGVEIRLSRLVAELSDRLTVESRTLVTDYSIVAFPTNRLLWHAASPRLRVLRPATDGSFGTQDLPAGNYRLAVLTDVERDELRQRQFLESIYDASIEISLVAGRTTQQDLRVRR